MQTMTPRLIAAAAIVALAGTAHADRYSTPAQNPADGDAMAGYSAAEQDAISARVNGLAGYFDATLSAEVIYNTGANTIAADNVRVTVPLLLWENDALMNTAVIERHTDGSIVGVSGTFTDGTFELFEIATARGVLASFSTITGANANNVFLQESFNGSEGDFNITRSNPMGQILPNGNLLFDANFNTNSNPQNNTEMLDLDGSAGANNGDVRVPNQTNFLVPPTVPYGSGVKLLKNPMGGDAGIDSNTPTGGASVRLATPSAVQDGSFFIQFFGNGWDGSNGNDNGGLATNGHTIFRVANNGTLGATAVDVADPQHAWPFILSGAQQAPAIPGAAQGDYRNNNAALFKLACGTTHIIGSYAVTGSNGAVGGASSDGLILFIDAANGFSNGTLNMGVKNGFADGAYYIPASPNFQQGFFAGQYDYTAMTGAGAPGLLGDYRFQTDNVSDNSARTFDANPDGDFVIVWQNRSDDSGTAMGNPFADERIYEVRLYEATVGGDCIADEYADPFVIARSGTTISERGITYNNGFEFDIPQTIFCNGVVPGVNNNVVFSGAAIDNDGNVSFTANTEVFVTDLVAPFPTFASCFDGSEDGSGADGVIDQFLDGSTSALFYYVRSEDALLKLVEGGIGGTELMSTVAGSPETLSLVLGRFTNDDDSDRFGGNSMTSDNSAESAVMAVSFRNGSFDRDANNDMDFDDPQGVFLSDGVTEEDGGLLLDRSQANFEDQVVAAVRGAVVVELGVVTIAPVNNCAYDVNNTGAVDIVDFTAFSMAFNSMVGDPNYDPALDFNNTGAIDIVDFTEFSMEFGRTDCLD